jgi:hypothetical protein
MLLSLGEKAPAWGLSRWNSGGLRFLPPDDLEPYTKGNPLQYTSKSTRNLERALKEKGYSLQRNRKELAKAKAILRKNGRCRLSIGVWRLTRRAIEFGKERVPF